MWKGVENEGLASKTQEFLDASECIYAIAYFLEHPEERSSKDSKEAKSAFHSWRAGSRCASKYKLPSQIESIFTSKPNRIRQKVKEALVSMLEALKTG